MQAALPDPKAFSIADISRASAELPAFVVTAPGADDEPDRMEQHAFVGRIISQQVQPGLFVSARDVTFLRGGELSIEAEGCLSCGMLLDGSCSPIEVDGHPPMQVERERAFICGNGKPARSTSRWVANERHVFSGFLLQSNFFERFGEDVADDGLRLLKEYCQSDYRTSLLPKSRRLVDFARLSLTQDYGPQLSALFLEANTLAFTIEVANMLQQSWKGERAIGRKHYERVLYACELLEADLANTPTTLALARQVGINVATLQAHFRATFGVGIFGYVRQQRLEAARHMVRDSALPIGEIGRQVGFSNPSAFSAAYRRQFGETPTRRVKQL